MLFQEGPNYARDPDKIPEEPGILRQASTEPVCPVVFIVRPRDIPMLPEPRNFKAPLISLPRCYSRGKSGLDLRRERSAVWPDNKSHHRPCGVGNLRWRRKTACRFPFAFLSNLPSVSFRDHWG
jgi:hypothetical protein